MFAGCAIFGLAAMGVPRVASAQPAGDADDAAPAAGEDEVDGTDGSDATTSTTTTPPTEPPTAASTPGASLSGVVDSPELEAPLAGATVTVVGTKTSATTDDIGNYSLALPPGKYVLEFALAGFQTVQRKVSIGVGESLQVDISLTTQQEESTNPSEVIVVVGSRTARSSIETTVPVDVITEQEIARSGRTETGRVIAALAPSFNATPQTISDGTDHVDPASLRGLGPDQVLVLVNGKRRHKSALLNLNGTFGRGTVGTDFNAIPISSIKRIEILRDGAASQYGSDAIAGVINIVTKDGTDHVELSQLAGVTGRGDGAQYETAGNYGFKLGDDGFLNLSGVFLSRGQTNRTGTYNGSIYTDAGTTDDQILADRNRSRSDFDMRIGEAAATTGQAAFSLESPSKDHAKFYAFGDVSYRNGDAAGFYRFPKQVAQNVPSFYPNGFLPLIHTNLSDAEITAGWRRTGNTDVDISLTHGRSGFQFEIENSVNASLGTASPTTFDAGTLKFQQTVANVDLLRKVDTTAVKSLSLVAGSEFRVENYEIVAGDEASYILGGATAGDPPQQAAAGAQVFPGFQPSNEVDRTRNSIGVYTGIEAQVTKRLTTDVGARFEQYSDFGNSLIGRLAARLEVANGLALRGAVNTGFRAPSLQQLWFSNVATQFLPDANGVLLPTQVLTSNNQSPVTKAFGIPKLNDEKSVNASGGFVIHPSDAFSFTADAYYIKLADRIVLTSTFAATANPIVADILAPFPGVSQAQFFANAIDTSTVGADLVADYNLDFKGGGALVFTGSANFTRTTVTAIHIPKSLLTKFGGDTQQLKNFYFGRLAENRIEDSVPHQRATLTARYALARFAGLVRGSYYGRVLYKPDNKLNDETFAPKVLADIALEVQLVKSLRLTLGADNVFNTFPDKQTKDANISSNRFIYSRNVSQFGQNGGFYYTKLEATW